MTLPLASLPPELIAHLLLFLLPDDIVNLSKCLDFEISEKIYRLVFPFDPPCKQYNRKVFDSRVKARLYVFGALTLGEKWTRDQLPASNFEWVHWQDGDVPRMHTPLKVESGDRTIVQVDSSGGVKWLPRSITVLDTKGELSMFFQKGETPEMFGLVRTETHQERHDDYEAGRFEQTPSQYENDKVTKLGIRASRAIFKNNSNSEDSEAVEQTITAFKAWRAHNAASRQLRALIVSEIRHNGMAEFLMQWAQTDERLDAFEQNIRHRHSHAFLINSEDNRAFTDSPKLHDISDKFFGGNRQGPPRFQQISCGVEMWAADESGMLWCWTLSNGCWTSKKYPKAPITLERYEGVPFVLQHYLDGEQITGKVSMIKNTDSFSSCLVENFGIVMYYMPPFTDTLHPNGWRSGYRCFDDHLMAVHATLFQNTVDGVRDYAFISRYQIEVLRTDGTIDVVDRRPDWNVEPVPNPSVFNGFGPFVQISKGNETFAALSEDGRVVGTDSKDYRDDFANAHVVEELAGINVVAIQAASHFYVALSDEGDVYSWGIEDGCNGSMGLGHIEEACKLDGVSINERGLNVTKPFKMKLPGKVFSVLADGDMTMVLADWDEEEA